MKHSIDAYDAKSRVEKYDSDMDIMHPNRFKMVDIALEFIKRKKHFMYKLVINKTAVV